MSDSKLNVTVRGTMSTEEINDAHATLRGMCGSYRHNKEKKLNWISDLITNRIYSHQFHINWTNDLDDLLKLAQYAEYYLKK